MTVLLWAVLGYLAGSVSLHAPASAVGWALARRLAPETARTWSWPVVYALYAGAVVAAARGMAGPYEAAGAAVGAVAGHCWPLRGAPRPRAGVAPATGAGIVLLPFETLAAAASVVAMRAVRLHAPANTVALVVVPILASLRGQPAPYRFAAWAALLLVIVRRLDGVGAELEATGSPVGVITRRVLLGADPPR
ncbi:MAG TPA: hypothetical protein VM840_11410 [Actinomycetota bacterium]|nr:hypothetical protein [Actinomycetota bacterium]